MPYYTGKAPRNMIVDKLVQLLTTPPAGSTKAYWKKVNTGVFTNDGYILKSTGKNDDENIFVRFSPSGTEYRIAVSTMEDYIPNAIDGLQGTIVNETGKAYIAYHNTNYGENFPVQYYLSFDRDKIMLVLKGDPTLTSIGISGMLWFGMPQRLDPKDKGNGAVAITCSTQAGEITTTNGVVGNYGHCRVVRNRESDVNALTYMRTLTGIPKSKGWDGQIFLPTIYLEDYYDAPEGIRSIMDGIHPIYQNASYPDFKEGDEFVKGAKRYTIFRVAYDGANSATLYSNAFPSPWMAMEQL